MLTDTTESSASGKETQILFRSEYLQGRKKAEFQGFSGMLVVLTDSKHVLCLGAFLRERDCESRLLSIFQRFKSIALGSTEVRKHV